MTDRQTDRQTDIQTGKIYPLASRVGNHYNIVLVSEQHLLPGSYAECRKVHAAARLWIKDKACSAVETQWAPIRHAGRRCGDRRWSAVAQARRTAFPTGRPSPSCRVGRRTCLAQRVPTLPARTANSTTRRRSGRRRGSRPKRSWVQRSATAFRVAAVGIASCLYTNLPSEAWLFKHLPTAIFVT